MDAEHRPAPRGGPIPVIGVSACRKYIAPHPFHAVGEKYLAALSVASRGLPLMIPALGRGVRSDELLSQIDGLFLTGSPSNVEPHQYQAEVVDRRSSTTPTATPPPCRSSGARWRSACPCSRSAGAARR